MIGRVLSIGIPSVVRLRGLRFLVVVGVVDTLHERLAVVDFRRKGFPEEFLDPGAIRDALAHGVEVVPLVDAAPIDAARERAFQHEVEPDARGAAVAFHEGVGDIHLDVFVGDFVECRFRHPLDRRKRRGEELRWREREVTL